MNNVITIFTSDTFGEIRTCQVNNQIMFVGKDVATALGYTNTLKAIRDHVDSEDKGVNEMVTPGGIQKVVIINESGLYSLILSSKLPQAKAFKRWVTSEVLPQIRQTDKILFLYSDTGSFCDNIISSSSL
jgi:prophage antirepressor-like protein